MRMIRDDRKGSRHLTLMLLPSSMQPVAGGNRRTQGAAAIPVHIHRQFGHHCFD